MDRVGGRLLTKRRLNPVPPGGLYSTLWMVRCMYRVDVYLRVRRVVMVEGDERLGSVPGVRSAS